MVSSGTKLLAHLLSILPLGWLIYAAYHRLLGGDPQEKVLHELGYWSMVFLLLCLSMTPLKLLFNKVPWIRFRRLLGLYAFFYACLHVLIFYFFHLGGDLALLWEETIKRPYITVGMLALLLLVPLAATSFKSAMRILKRRWVTIHKLVYVIAALVLTHFTWQSKSDLNEPLLYILWGGLLLLFRLPATKRYISAKHQVST